MTVAMSNEVLEVLRKFDNSRYPDSWHYIGRSLYMHMDYSLEIAG